MNQTDPFLQRIHSELSASFRPERPVLQIRVPELIEIMGGWHVYTGSTVLWTCGKRATHLVWQPRDDAQVQIFAFDRYDAHLPFTLVVPIEALIRAPIDQLTTYFSDPTTRWACGIVLTIRAAIENGFQIPGGSNIAINSTSVDPIGPTWGVLKLLEMTRGNDPFNWQELWKKVRLYRQQVEGCLLPEDHWLAITRVKPGHVTRIRCQPDESVMLSSIPIGVCFSSDPVSYRTPEWETTQHRIEVASMIGHKLILEKMRQIGKAAGRELVGDPMGGFLSNLSLDDYRRFFRPYLPENLKGGVFLLEHRSPSLSSIPIHPDTYYPVRSSCDWHVFSSHRVGSLISCLEKANQSMDPDLRMKELNKVGHLLYAAHASLSTDAGLTCEAADQIVARVRENERRGYYGAGLTRSGVVILQDEQASEF